MHEFYLQFGYGLPGGPFMVECCEGWYSPVFNARNFIYEADQTDWVLWYMGKVRRVWRARDDGEFPHFVYINKQRLHVKVPPQLEKEHA